MKFGWFAAACLAVLMSGPAVSATLQLEITAEFDATKVDHSCVDGLFLGDPNPGDGLCGAYQSVAMDDAVTGTLNFSGMFETVEEGWSLMAGGLDAISCRVGSSVCLTSLIADASIFDDILQLRLFGGFQSSFVFDLTSGTGTHTWVDDALPFFGKGSFALTNADVSFSESLNTEQIAVTPLPAGAWLLLTGALALGALRRRPLSQNAPQI